MLAATPERACIILVRYPESSTQPARQLGIYRPADKNQPAKHFMGNARDEQPCKTLPQNMDIAAMLQNSTYPAPFLYLSQEAQKLENFYNVIQTNEVQNWLDKIFPFELSQRKPKLLPGFTQSYDPFDL
jgi:hypothetical protein